MRALILACLLLGCGTGTEIDGTAEGCPETEIDLTVPQVLTYCWPDGWTIAIDTDTGRCADVMLGGECRVTDCPAINSASINWMGAPVLLDCDAMYIAGQKAAACAPPPETLEACQWLTE